MKILTFGEIMLRLKTPEHLRIVQANGFEASYAARNPTWLFPSPPSGMMPLF